MVDPFKIDGPTCVSFSGGRTSAYMLRRLLDANGGLPQDAHIIFANTGKEEEATLEFVRDCADRWGVPIWWVEFDPQMPDSFKTVDFSSAARDSEPFDALITKKGDYLPNPVERFCTVELKIKPAIALMRSIGYEEHDNFVGMRADEPARVAKIRANPSGGDKGVERRAPLADAGIGKWDVLAFWAKQPFNLELQVVNGITFEGNCDLCFNKPPFQRLSLIKAKPTRAVWWIAKEKQAGGTFAKNEPSYAEIARFAESQNDMFDPNQEATPCFCGD